MGGKRPYAPRPELFAKEQILVVARVTPATKDLDKVFEVDRVIEKGRDLEFRFRFAKPDSSAGFDVKSQLSVWIPKRDYAKVTFVENGKSIGVLDLAKGQWAVPTPPAGPAK